MKISVQDLAHSKGVPTAVTEGMLALQSQLIAALDKIAEMQDWEAVAADQALTIALLRVEQEPVEYQMRLRPTWEVTSWSDWKKCSRDSAGDYAKTPKLHDWEYETRELYTQAITQAIPQIPQEPSSNEPVAFLCHGNLYMWPSEDDFCGNPEDHIPLYTSPPKRQPLTESMIKAGLDELEAIRQTELVGDYELIKRLLEAAHGIGDKT